jgi:hypothetical protein
MDLEGIVAKDSLSPYTTERTTWFKIKNRSYSRCKAARNYSSGNAIRSQSLAGTHVSWLVRRNMPTEKHEAPSVWKWIGGFLITAAALAALIAGYFYLHTAK